MAKKVDRYVCTECNKKYQKQTSFCANCQNFDTVIEVVSEVNTKTKFNIGNRNVRADYLSNFRETYTERLLTGIDPVDRVFGGGIKPNTIVAIGGYPGAGKSTLALTVLSSILRQNPDMIGLYATGEESLGQLNDKFTRLQCSDVTNRVLAEYVTSLEDVITLAENASIIVIDSINTLASEQLDSSPNSVSQIRHCSNVLRQYAKTENKMIIIISQVNKSGEISGTQELQHVVDAVFYFDDDAATNYYKILRSTKNRDGDTSEVAICTMDEDGLQFLTDFILFDHKDEKLIGSSVTGVSSGTRFLFTQLQALCTVNSVQSSYSQRSAIGIPKPQLIKNEAVINKYVLPKIDGLPDTLDDFHIQVASVGGIKPEWYNDLSLIMSIISSISDVPIPQSSVFVGEVTLVGKVRAFPNINRLVTDALNYGFDRIYVPKTFEYGHKKKGVVTIDNVSELIKVLR